MSDTLVRPRPKLSELQRKVVEFNYDVKPEHLILHGAVRSGKTAINNFLWLDHVRSYRDRGLKFIMTSTTLGTLERNVLDDMRDFGIDTKLNQRNEFELYGNTMCCFGTANADSEDAIQGFTAYGWYANEVTKHHPQAVKQCNYRCSGEGARKFWDCNPAGKNHYIKTDYIDTADGIHTKCFNFKLTDNPFLPPDYIEGLKRNLPETSVYYKRDILGLWVAAGNIIYDHYKIEPVSCTHNIVNEYDELIAGVDFGRGGQSPFAFLLIGRTGNDYTILKEVYRSECLNSEFISMVDQTLNSISLEIKPALTVYGDSADPDKITEWARAGYRIIGADKGQFSVRSGIEAVMGSGLTINDACHETINEIQSYEWMVDKDGKMTDAPVKYNDHAMDAMRYAIYTHGKKVNAGEFKIYFSD